MDYLRLSKTVSHALRHEPWQYELELDDEGWVPLDQLLDSLDERRAFAGVSRADIEGMMKISSKQRFELADTRIRALYGHSIPGKLQKRPATPPDILYHGTVKRVLPLIYQGGLKPMKRQYVHLSIDIETADLVASRKGTEIVILKIKSGEGSAAGVRFYMGNPQTWLADEVPADLIVFPEDV